MPSRNLRRKGGSNGSRVAETEPPYLTQRELEVIEWIAEGKRNREIGEILGCSERTVQKHVQHILEKLHVESRIAVCIWWFERRLEEKKLPRPRRSSSRG